MIINIKQNNGVIKMTAAIRITVPCPVDFLSTCDCLANSGSLYIT